MPSATHITKKNDPLPRTKCGHNMFLKERNAQRNADPLAPRGRASRNAFLAQCHAEWGAMSPTEQEQYHQRAALEPVVVRLQPVVVDAHGTDPMAPWGVGSVTYPLSIPNLQEVVDEMLPVGKRRLREAYSACRAAASPEAVANAIVRDSQPKLDMNGTRRRRTRARTCWEAHPGLCISHVNASSIIKFHVQLAIGLRSFNDLKPDTTNGLEVFLFVGFRRKREAERAIGRRLNGQDLQDIEGDEFEMAFVSDQPDRRRRLMSFTRCEFAVDDQRTFHCGSFARLVRNEHFTLDDVESFGFAKLLRDRSRNWLVHQLAYEDVPEEPEKPKPAPANALDDADPLGLEAAFDFIGGGAGAASGEEGPSDDSSLPDVADEHDTSDESEGQGLEPSRSDEENISDADVPEQDAEAPGSDGRHVRRLRGLGLFERDGKHVKFDGKVLGQISSWQGNVSCVCKLHRACRSPAARNWESDSVLEDWLLTAVTASGDLRVDKDAHMRRITGIRAQMRVAGPGGRTI